MIFHYLCIGNNKQDNIIMKKERDYFGIFNSRDLLEDSIVNEIRDAIALCREISPERVTEEDINEYFWDDLDVEKTNLDIDTNKVIIAFSDLQFWNGHRCGYKVLGSNVNSIFDFFEYYDYEWYADKFDVRCNLYHHDGTHSLVFRCVKDDDTADRICQKIYNGQMDEAEFIKQTTSLRPYVSKVYGWPNFRRTKK